MSLCVADYTVPLLRAPTRTTTVGGKAAWLSRSCPQEYPRRPKYIHSGSFIGCAPKHCTRARPTDWSPTVTPQRNVGGNEGLGGRTISFSLKKRNIMLDVIMSVCCDTAVHLRLCCYASRIRSESTIRSY